MKTIIIIHGWGGSSNGDWIPWLATECKKLGYNVIVPDMPDTDAPDIDKWVGYLKNILQPEADPPLAEKSVDPVVDFGIASTKSRGAQKRNAKIHYRVDENTYFVGHSIGCQTILRFLAEQDQKVGGPSPRRSELQPRAGGAVFVAGWFTLMNLNSAEAENGIAKPWLETPIDFEKVKNILPKSVVIFSDNDPFVPLAENKKIFEEKLDSRVVVVHNAGHITSDDGFTEIPEVLNQLKIIIKNNLV